MTKTKDPQTVRRDLAAWWKRETEQGKLLDVKLLVGDPNNTSLDSVLQEMLAVAEDEGRSAVRVSSDSDF